MASAIPRCFILVVFLIVIPEQQLRAGTIRYVDVNASGPTHDGSSWCSAFTDLQDALDVAVATDEIRIADGIYRPDGGTGNRELSFQLKSGVKIYGGYAGCNATNPDARNISSFETILSGDLTNNDGSNFTNYSENSYHVVAAVNVDDTGLLDGVTVSDGNADGPNFGPDPSSKDQGSGINNYWSTARYENCTLSDNFSANHGAFNDHGGATLINCTLENNESGMWGGGLFVAPNITATVTGCNFINNHTVGIAGGGGGIANGGDSVFTNCLIQGNTSDTNGAGMYNHSGSQPILSNCIIESNESTADNYEDERGGGMYNILSSPTLNNCTIKTNISALGGGIYNDASNCSLNQCDLTANHSYRVGGIHALVTAGGGGIYNTNNSHLNILGCQFSSNTSVRFGSAIYADLDCILSMQQCTFNENVAYWGSVWWFGGSIDIHHNTFTENRGNYAGALNLRYCTGVISDNLFLRNVAFDWDGGAIVLGFVDIDIVNCEFKWNQAATDGGAVDVSTSNVRFSNSLFIGNVAGEKGGAIHQIRTYTSGTNATFVNCTFKGNTALNGSSVSVFSPAIFTKEAVNSFTAHNCIFWEDEIPFWQNDNISNVIAITHSNVKGGWSGTGNINQNPLFVNAANDLRLTTSSPCFNAGDNSFILADAADLDNDGNTLEDMPFDMDGNARVASVVVDMGAFELTDCNNNGVPDVDDLIGGTSQDCTGNAVPDECEPDCDGNGMADSCEIFDGLDDDCNSNLIPDRCDVADGLSPDCNGNQIPDQCDIDSGFSFDVNNNQIPDHCETDCNGNGVPDAFEIVEGMISDCNSNLIPDDCDMDDHFGFDCNDNSVLDVCDIADGTSFDVNNNCIPDECNQYLVPLAEEFPINKNRFISFIPVNYSCNTAIRITLSSLHHPDPPMPDSPDFSEFEGQVRWASPPNSYIEDGAGQFMFWASSLQCEPYFTDWSSVSLLHLFGAAIVPSSAYLIEVVGDDCIDLNDPNCYSDILEVRTGRWGDIVSPIQNVDGSHQPTIDDVLAAIGKWLGNLKPIIAQTLLQNNVPDPSQGVSIDDVIMAVNAWLSAPYPYTGPESCP